MTRVVFVEDAKFEENLLHWRGSLNPVGDVFRRASDKMAKKVQAVAKTEANSALAAAAALHQSRFRKSGRVPYRTAKALAYSLSNYARLVHAIEIHGIKENVAIVAAGHAAGAAIEFGGTDNVLEVLPGVPLTYSAMSILRRGI